MCLEHSDFGILPGLILALGNGKLDSVIACAVSSSMVFLLSTSGDQMRIPESVTSTTLEPSEVKLKRRKDGNGENT